MGSFSLFTHSYELEKRIIDLVKEGNVEKIKTYIKGLKTFDINAVSVIGDTLLHHVRDVNVAEFLKKQGITVFDKPDREGWTPFHKAAFDLNVDMMIFLLENKINPKLKTYSKETALDLARLANHFWLFSGEKFKPIEKFLSDVIERGLDRRRACYIAFKSLKTN